MDFDHGAGRWGIGRIDDLARKLHALIDAHWIEAGGFDEVILVGHSAGGLIVRQAYLMAMGATPGEKATSWGHQVGRIVLLASLNRGIDTNRTLGVRFFTWMTRVIPFLPHFRMHDVLRGSNLLTSLRINWIRHFGALTDAQRQGEQWPDGRPKRVPLVIQLVGSEDGLVHEDDSKDVLAFPGGHYLRVPDANHSTLYRIDVAPEPRLRFALLKKGFAGEFPEDPAPVANGRRDDPIKRVVFLLHGIRASNVDDWIKELEQRIKQRDPKHTGVKHPTYGYFTAARFALPTVRRKNIRVFQDWYTEALAEHPNAEFNIIAHSNGTYILGQSLLATPDMKFNRVALAGSVLPCNFSWAQRKANEQVKRVRNDRANRDWPVALLCNALRGLFMKDVGTGGFDGFDGNATEEIAYFPGGHGTALAPENQESLVDFIFDQEAPRPTMLMESPGYYRQLSNLAPYFAKFVAFLILIVVVCLIKMGMWVPVVVLALVAVFVWVILDIL